jgi:hypothetical protein
MAMGYTPFAKMGQSQPPRRGMKSLSLIASMEWDDGNIPWDKYQARYYDDWLIVFLVLAAAILVLFLWVFLELRKKPPP